MYTRRGDQEAGKLLCSKGGNAKCVKVEGGPVKVECEVKKKGDRVWTWRKQVVCNFA